jgi:cell division septum initiation protein DivIVA
MSLTATLDQLANRLRTATAVPLSASCVVNRAELLAIVEQATASIPAEVEDATGLLEQREELLAQARTDAQQTVAAARARADELVALSSVVDLAQQRAAEIVAEAKAEADRLLRDADDYCDRRLALLEVDLDKALGVVRRGRQRLVERRDEPAQPAPEAEGAGAGLGPARHVE